MSTRRLNGWQRLGVVLSAIWALFGFILGSGGGMQNGDWSYAFIFSLVPIPFAWLAVWGALRATRWVKAGFIENTENDVDTKVGPHPPAPRHDASVKRRIGIAALY